jgi:ATP-binding cassette subfamily B protein
MKNNSQTTRYFYKAISLEISKYKKQIFLVLFCIALAKAATFSIPYLLKLLIDRLSSASEYHPVFLSTIGLITCYVLINIASIFFNEIKEYLSTKVTQVAVSSIGKNIFKHLLSLDMKFHLEIKTGVLTRDVDRGLKGIQSITGVMIYSIAPTFIELILVLTYFYISYDLIFLQILVLSLFVYIIYSIYTTNIWATSRHHINQSDSDANQKLLESLLNIETIKYFTTESHELEQYQKSLKKYAQASIEAQSVHSKLAIGQQIIISLGLGITLWQASLGVGNGTMTIGDVVLINALMLQVYMPLSFLGIIYKDIKQCVVDVERLGNVINESASNKINYKDEYFENKGLNIKYDDGFSIKFEDITFSYSNDREILKSISFEIPNGTTTAIVGTTGAGKSTIPKLLLKIYPINEGIIKINNIDLRKINTKSIREMTGVISQEISLFNGTIYYNIQYGNLNATQREIEEAAKSAQVHDFIISLKDGYQTIVGERGLKLSGGERQRIAIARALIKKPSLLIFDEATSALDTKTENAFQLQLLKSIGNQTSLIIAHRLSTITNADNILVLDQGRIIESGTHIELIKLKGTYFTMWKSQQTLIN